MNRRTADLPKLPQALSYVDLLRKIDDARQTVLGSEISPKRVIVYLVIAIGGAAFTVTCSLWQPLRTTWNSLFGFFLELSGGAGYFWTMQSAGQKHCHSGSYDDMARYDALHDGYEKIINWAAGFGARIVEERIETLNLFNSTADAASRWLYGPSERLGVLPALAALLIQAPTLSGTHGTISTVAASMLVVFTFLFCATTFATTKEQIRDRRLGWILQRALLAARSSQASTLWSLPDQFVASEKGDASSLFTRRTP
jgi:hypothetical protein